MRRSASAQPWRRASARNEGRTRSGAGARSQEPLDVLGHDEGPVLEQCPCPCSALERKTAPDRGADGDVLERSRRPHEVDDPALEQVVDVDVGHGIPQDLDLVEADDRLEQAQRMSVALLLDDLQLLVRRRIAECGLEKEAVELGFRQRERSFVFDRVLCCQKQNALGRMRVWPSTVTWCSAIASSSADCVFGIARLISSTRTTFAKIGPG